MWNTITSFFVKHGTSEEHADIASELAFCYHNVKHSLIHNKLRLQHKIKPSYLQ
jgi:hypothetical protein